MRDAVSDPQLLALATVGRMVTTVAHEIRNLLGGVELYASLLAEQQSDRPDCAALSARLLSGIARLRAVAGNLLTVPRPGSGEHLPVDVAHVVAATVDAVRLTLAGTGVDLRYRDTAGKAVVLGDADRLHQALLNLVINAVQAMPDGGRLTIVVRAAGNQVEVVVADTGIGMDRSTLQRATEAFFTTRPTGTGLGLAVVRDVVESHHGRAVFTSRPGRGTTVRVRLPIACDASVSADDFAPGDAPGALTGSGDLR
jgi:signal transduction histidine kinase